MERKWLVRTYEEGDENRIFDLWNAVYPEQTRDKKGWLSWWRWTCENPAGGRVWLAEHDGRIVGQYRITFVDLKVGDTVLKAFQAVDLMTHPDYRGQGVNSSLKTRAIEDATEAGFSIEFGFPNERSYAMHAKHPGFFDPGTMELLIKPLNWKNFLKAKVRNGWLAAILGIMARGVFDKILARTREAPYVEGLHVNRVRSFDNRIERLWRGISSQHKVMVVRNEQYLRWRYSAPGQSYLIFAAEKQEHIVGYLVAADRISGGGSNMTYIYDLVAESTDVMHSLLSKLLERCKLMELDLILYPLIANRTYRRTLNRNGFISVPFVRGRKFVGICTSQSLLTRFLARRENWFVQIGDSDES